MDLFLSIHIHMFVLLYFFYAHSLFYRNISGFLQFFTYQYMFLFVFSRLFFCKPFFVMTTPDKFLYQHCQTLLCLLPLCFCFCFRIYSFLLKFCFNLFFIYNLISQTKTENKKKTQQTVNQARLEGLFNLSGCFFSCSGFVYVSRTQSPCGLLKPIPTNVADFLCLVFSKNNFIIIRSLFLIFQYLIFRL